MSTPSSAKALRTYFRWRAIGLAATCLLFIGHFFLPPRTLPLTITGENTGLYGYSDNTRGKSSRWASTDGHKWICDYRPTDAYGCGWNINTTPIPGKGVDIGNFQALEVTLNYSGPASRIRAFMRNFNPAYSTPENPDSTKPMEASFATRDAEGPVHVQLNEFRVAGWWLSQRKSHRSWPTPEFTNIVAIGVDFPEPGLHEVEIEQLVLMGRWITTETLLIAIISFWMAVFIGEGTVRFYGLYRATQRDRQAIRELEQKQRRLTEENLHLEALANTDPLTGIDNRTGLQRRLEAMALRDNNLAGVGVLALDLDHFKALNDRYGHDMGDKVLKTVAALLAMNLRGDDVFARIGGEEFVVVCRRQPLEGVYAVAEKLRQITSQCTFYDESRITVSIGISIINEGEDFTDALKRADDALYRAKQNGRNRVEVGYTS